jgi:hypothetical protein
MVKDVESLDTVVIGLSIVEVPIESVILGKFIVRGHNIFGGLTLVNLRIDLELAHLVGDSRVEMVINIQLMSPNKIEYLKDLIIQGVLALLLESVTE